MPGRRTSTGFCQGGSSISLLWNQLSLIIEILTSFTVQNLNILKFLYQKKKKKGINPKQINHPFSSLNECENEEMFWYHFPKFSVTSTLSAKAFLYHKGLFSHLCLCKPLLTNHIVIGEKIKSLEQVSLRELSESSLLLENVSVSRNVIIQNLFNSEIQKGLFYHNSCHPNGPLDKKVLKCSAG